MARKEEKKKIKSKSKAKTARKKTKAKVKPKSKQVVKKSIKAKAKNQKTKKLITEDLAENLTEQLMDTSTEVSTDTSAEFSTDASLDNSDTIDQASAADEAKALAIAEEKSEQKTAAKTKSKSKSSEDEIDPDRRNHLKGAMEAILFVNDHPVSAKKFSNLIDPQVKTSEYKKLIQELVDDYDHAQHGITIEQVAEGFQFRTKVGFSKYIQAVHKVVPVKLTKTTLEALSIIAYRQPVTKADLDEIRGVDNSHSIRILLERSMIAVTGRSEAPGRPAIYSTTRDFLNLFGLNSLNDLPPLSEIEAMVPTSQAGDPDTLHHIVEQEGNLDFSDDAQLENIQEEIAKIATNTDFTKALNREGRKSAKAGSEEDRPRTAMDLIDDFVDELDPKVITGNLDSPESPESLETTEATVDSIMATISEDGFRERLEAIAESEDMELSEPPEQTAEISDDQNIQNLDDSQENEDHSARLQEETLVSEGFELQTTEPGQSVEFDENFTEVQSKSISEEPLIDENVSGKMTSPEESIEELDKEKSDFQ